jgi:hypothetical protein
MDFLRMRVIGTSGISGVTWSAASVTALQTSLITVAI